MSRSEEFHKACNLSRTKFAPFCSEPVPKDEYVKCRWMMAGSHLMFIEAFQNIYRKAESITPADEQAFAFMCNAILGLLTHHHHAEDTAFFPALEPEFKVDFKRGHDSFQVPLDAFDNYIKGVLGVDNGKLYGQVIPSPHREKLPYSGAKLRRLIEDLADPLFTSLNDEVDWVDPDRMRASGVSEAKLIAAVKAEEHHIQTTVDPSSALVCGMGHIPPYCQFPDVPWFGKKIMIPWVFYWKHRSSWKFFPTWSENGLPVE